MDNLNYKVFRIIAFSFVFSTISQFCKAQYSNGKNCVTHRAIVKTPVLIKIYINGNYVMKDLSEAQISGREYFLISLNSVNKANYKLSDGQEPDLTFTITINEYNSYFGANVEMLPKDPCLYDSDRSFNTKLVEIGCTASRKFDTNYATVEKLYYDIAKIFNGFITGGWCTDCTSPCNPY